MPNLDDNQKQPVQTKNDWTDNLLVKDKTGKFHSLKGDQGPVESVESAPQTIDKKIDVSAAPIKDNFVPVEYNQMGRSDDKATFAFHPEDKDQIDSIAKDIPIDDSKKYSVEKIVDKLIEKQELKFDNENKEKFIELIYQFFRNRRKVPIIREMLSTKIVSAKKKLNPQVVDNILSVVKGIKSRIDAEGGLVVRQSSMPSLPEASVSSADGLSAQVGPKSDFTIPPKEDVKVIEDEFSNIKGELEADKEIEKALSEIEKVEEKPVPAPVPEPEPQVEEDEEKPIPIKKPEQVKPPVAPPTPTPKPTVKVQEKDLESLPKVVRPGQAQMAKKQIVDVVSKTPPPVAPPTPSQPVEQPVVQPEVKHVLSGPVQELQDMSLKNFKRLAENAEKRAGKVLEKINILEQDSYTKKAQGIEAWRRSETYKLYLALGAESMIENKKIEDLAVEKKAKGEDFLDAEDFAAISDLNKKLRF